MSNYDRYKHLINLAYDDGDKDCYGLCRQFYLDNYDIELPNYARSSSFFSEGIDLIAPFLRDSDFKVVDVAPSLLEVGDGLMFTVRRPWMRGEQMINHVAVFVGNGTFLHHLYDKPSCEDYIAGPWSRRLMAVVRHPDVAALNAAYVGRNAVQLFDILPNYAKRRLSQKAPGILDSSTGEGRTDP
jgi:cell wall-associated NlpC family hydrolase